MENALYDFYSRVEKYQKTFSLATGTRPFSFSSQLVIKSRTHPFRAVFKRLSKNQSQSNYSDQSRQGETAR